MALTSAQRRVFDKNQGIGKSMDEAKAASAARAKPVAKEKESVMGRVARKLKKIYYKKKKWAKRTGKELRHGDKTYMPKKKITTTRTKDVTSGLKQAGLTAKEIAKLRGKK